MLGLQLSPLSRCGLLIRGLHDLRSAVAQTGATSKLGQGLMSQQLQLHHGQPSAATEQVSHQRLCAAFRPTKAGCFLVLLTALTPVKRYCNWKAESLTVNLSGVQVMHTCIACLEPHDLWGTATHSSPALLLPNQKQLRANAGCTGSTGCATYAVPMQMHSKR